MVVVVVEVTAARLPAAVVGVATLARQATLLRLLV